MAEDSSFVDLMEQLRNGDQQAAARIFDLYAKRLIGLASKKLTPRIAQKESPEDVAQSALKSFFLRQQRQPFDLSNWNNLWSLLARITLNKIGQRVEHWHAQKVDVRREQGLAASPSGTDESTASWIAIAREPSASEAVSLQETLEQVLADLDARERLIVQMALDEEPVAAIARKFDTTEYRVNKVLDKVREKWKKLAGEDD